MTAMINSTTSVRQQRRAQNRLMGFGPFFRKELSDWWHSRRAGVIAIVTSLLVVSVAIVPWLQVTFPPTGGTPPDVSLDPTFNVLSANWVTWLTIISIFAAMSLLVGERDKGTLAWSLSNPLSRQALLFAKWSAGTLMYALFGVLLPVAVVATVVTLAYGSVPDLGVLAGLTVALVAMPAFFIALSLALGTRISSGPAVAGISLVVAYLPMILGVISADLAVAMPSSIGSWAVGLAAGADAGWLTPAGWLLGMVVLALAARLAFARSEV
jgi:ABC-type transport system involved in multi-copper enzyme maturation permease subunit